MYQLSFSFMVLNYEALLVNLFTSFLMFFDFLLENVEVTSIVFFFSVILLKYSSNLKCKEIEKIVIWLSKIAGIFTRDEVFAKMSYLRHQSL